MKKNKLINSFISLFLVLIMILGSNGISDLTKGVISFVTTPKAATDQGNSYTLKSNDVLINSYKIPEVYRTGNWATRRFVMKCYPDKKAHRVFCGYGAGKSHPGDHYRCYTMSVAEFVSKKTTVGARSGAINGTAGNGVYGRNPNKIAQALHWYFNIQRMGDGHDKNKELAAQSYIWGASQNKDLNKILKEIGKYDNKVSYSKIKSYWKAIGKVSPYNIEGQIQVYDFYAAGKKCVAHQSGVHQPYYRLAEPVPDPESVTAGKKVKVTKEISFEVIKTDEYGKPIPGVEFTVSLNKSGYTGATTGRTGADGKVRFTLTKSYTGSIPSGKYKRYYVKNWNELTSAQKKAWANKGYYANYQLAYNKLQSDLEEPASILAANAATAENATWTVKEVSVPKGYTLIQGTENNTDKKATINRGKATTKFYENGNLVRVTENKVVKKVKASFKLTNVNAQKYGKIIINKEASSKQYSDTYSLNGASYDVIARFKGTKKDGTEFNSGDVVASITVTSKDNHVQGETDQILPCGDYYIKETKAPKGFELDSTNHPVTITDDTNLSTFTVSDTRFTHQENPKNGSIYFYKLYGDEDNTQPESNAVFNLKGNIKMADGNYYNKNASADPTTGKVEFTNVPFGTYTITQVGDAVGNNGESIEPLNSINITIDENKPEANPDNTEELSANATLNPPITNKIKIVKYWRGQTGDISSDGEILKTASKEADAVFRIYKGSIAEVRSGNENNYEYDESKKVEDITTQANGIATSSELEPGQYVLHQISGMDGYTKVGDQEITISEEMPDKPYKYEKFNEENSEYIHFYKVTQDLDYKGKPSGSVKFEKDAEFYLFDLSKINISELDGFSEWTDDERTAFINNHQDDLLPLKQGTSYPVKTDENGECKVPLKLNYHTPDEGFAIVQTKGSRGYNLTEPILSSSFEKKTDNTYVYWDRKEPIINYSPVFYGVAKIHKEKIINAEEETVPEEGAKFRLLTPTGEEFYYPPTEEDPNKQIKTFTTDENGNAYIPYLYPGIFTLVQDSGSEAHRLMDDIQLIVFSDHCTMTDKQMKNFIDNGYDESVLSQEQKQIMQELSEKTSSIVNQPMYIYLNIEKRSTETQIKLNNAEFTLYKITGNDPVNDRKMVRAGKTGDLYQKGDDWDSLTTEQQEERTLGKLDFRIEEYGKYVLVEEIAPFGYLLTETNTGVLSTDPNFKKREIYFTVDADHAKKDNELGTLYYDWDQKTAREEGGLDGNALIINDMPIKGKIGVNKFGQILTGSDSNMGTLTYDYDKLAGCEFQLKAVDKIVDDANRTIFEAGQVISPNVHFITDNNGQVMFYYEDPYTHQITDDFPMGNYEITEINAPDNYNLLDKPISVGLCNDSTATVMSQASEEIAPPDEDSGASDNNYKAKYFLEEGTKLNSRGIRNAKRIIFTHFEGPASAIDVSAAQDESVKLWHEGTTYYISSEKNNQNIYFNYDCSYMFSGCEQLEEIIFNNIDTSYMADSSNMFLKCKKIKELDLSNFTTPRLECSDYMFKDCILLETIYFGEEIQTTPTDDMLQTLGIDMTGPEQRGYYAPLAESDDPDINEDNQRSNEANKFQPSEFKFSYTNASGFGDDIEVLPEHIKSITPAYPNFLHTENPNQREGMLEVTVELDPNSPAGQEQLAYHDGDLESLKFKCKVKIIDPDYAKKANEKPEAIPDAFDTLNPPNFRFRKVNANDVNDDDPLSQVTNVKTYSDTKFEIRAATTIVDNHNNVIKVGSDVDKAASVIGQKRTESQQESDGDVELGDLLSGYYQTQNPNAPYLFEIEEIEAPPGLELNPNQEDNIVRIPNIKFTREALSASDAQKITNASTDTIKVMYQYEDGKHLIALQFSNPDATADYIKKRWDNTKGIPDSLTINIKDKNNGNVVGSVQLTKEEQWVKEWDDTLKSQFGTIRQAYQNYDFEEVAQEGYFWENTSTDLVQENDDYYSLVFKNSITKHNEQYQKIWSDNNNADEIRPTTLLVKLFRITDDDDDEEIYSEELNEANHWKSQKVQVDTRDANGNEYQYEWREISVTPDYGIDFPNTDVNVGYVPGEPIVHFDTAANANITEQYNYHGTNTSAPVEKIWDDENSELRPKSIRAKLYQTVGNNTTPFSGTFKVKTQNEAGGTSISNNSLGFVILNKSNQWKAEALDLPAFTADKQPIKYTWKEEAINANDLEEYSTTTTVTEIE